jgi:hypothetical protein
LGAMDGNTQVMLPGKLVVSFSKGMGFRRMK